MEQIKMDRCTYVTSEGHAYELHDTNKGWFWSLIELGHSRNGPFNTRREAVNNAEV